MNAPVDVLSRYEAERLAELASLLVLVAQGQVSHYEKELTDLRTWHREAAEARATVAEMIDALRFYANPEVYKAHPHGPAFDDRDISFVARNALARVGDAPAVTPMTHADEGAEASRRG